MKRILIIDTSATSDSYEMQVRGQTVKVTRRGSSGIPDRIGSLIAEHREEVAAIGLDGIPLTLRLGPARVSHRSAGRLLEAAGTTPLVDGSGVRAGIERWGVILADRAEPGIFSEKRILMVPGLNHAGLAQALGRHSASVRYADPEIYFGLPDFPGVGSRKTLDQAAGPTLERLQDAPFTRVHPSGEGNGRDPSARFRWADVLAGDIEAIRKFGPRRMKRKTVVVPWAREEDAVDLMERGASILVTLMPTLDPAGGLAPHSSAVLEAAFLAVSEGEETVGSEDTYLNLMAELEWSPTVRYLQPEEAGINRFAFVIHPLSVKFINKHPTFRWTRHLPDPVVEEAAAWMKPMYVSKIRGGESPSTGQRIEGHLISLGATPRQMMRHGERFTYSWLNEAARMAERMGCRLMGLGAFTSVVGDAGMTVAHEADIAITSGNSLTVSATLEAAKQGAIKMGWTDLTKGRAMVIGATGSIGSVCSRLLALAIRDVVLVSIEPEKLIDLKRTIEAETPGARVSIATKPDDLVGGCDLIVTATSAFGQRILDISLCKPGAVICDVARPPDVSAGEAALRPDLLIIESGEVMIPGDVDFGYDIGLPPKTAYACLAETALLAMEGRFENYTLGRNIDMERVKEIYRLFKKHDFQIAGLRSFGHLLTDEDFAEKRALAEDLRRHPEEFNRLQREVGAKLAAMPVAAKGVVARKRGSIPTWAKVAGGVGLGAMMLRRRRRKSRRRSETADSRS